MAPVAAVVKVPVKLLFPDRVKVTPAAVDPVMARVIGPVPVITLLIVRLWLVVSMTVGPDRLKVPELRLTVPSSSVMPPIL